MKFYVLEPEVAGGFGEHSVLDPKTRPPRVKHLHYEFDGWLGDPILETICTFIVTESLKNELLKLGASGISFGPVEISKSSEFEEIYPDQHLPPFRWLQISGKAGIDDFGLSTFHRLVVSQRVLDLCLNMGMAHADVSDFGA